MALQKTAIGELEIDDRIPYQRRVVIGGMVSGENSTDTAKQMGCSTNNINKHKQSLYTTLGADNGPCAIALLFKNKWIRFVASICVITATITQVVTESYFSIDQSTLVARNLRIKTGGRSVRGARNRSQLRDFNLSLPAGESFLFWDQDAQIFTEVISA